MKLTHAIAILSLAVITSAAPAPAPEADPTLGFLINIWNSWFWKFTPRPVPQWPPQPPSRDCPSGWPSPWTPWNPWNQRFPGICKPIGIPVYKPKCKKTTRPPKPNPPGPGPQPPTPSPPSGPMYFQLRCPDLTAGSIFDGQIQCNSPYPALDVANPSKGPAAANTKFYLTDGALFDQFDRACEISAGNQLQCNKVSNLSAAMKGFSINEAGQLEFNAENTWYGCNIGTEASYGQIVFTGTHLEFSGTQTDTTNPNCDAYRLTVSYVS